MSEGLLNLPTKLSKEPIKIKLIMGELSSINDNKIGSILLKENYVTGEDIENARKFSVENRVSLVDYLLSERLITKDLLGQAIGEYFNVPYVNLKKERIDEDVFDMIPELVAQSKGVVAFSSDEKGIKVGMINPNNIEIRHLLEKRFGKRVIPYYITEQDLKESLLDYKAGLKDDFKEILKKVADKKITREERDEIIVDIVDMLLQYGHQNKASDIHIEPYTKKAVVRFRIDGIMHDVLEIPKELMDFIISRIKILAKMRTDVHRAAQDGKLNYQSDKDEIDVRVSIVPVIHGENAVMRLLNAKNKTLTLANLGFMGEDLVKLKKAVKKTSGMVLVTGPTGSGKTTTLYAILKILNKREINISTIEDPVEYDIDGISQIQVNNMTGLTFAKGLRAIVRQDPDVIMVGEIRDEETAGIAVNSALTGHLVLSTLHTNDATTTLPRLLDMEIEPFLVASTVNIVIAQRLVRKICEKCRTSYSLTKEEARIIKNSPVLKKIFEARAGKKFESLRVYKGGGCKVCNFTGYTGRLGIFEVLELTDEVKEAILKKYSSDEIKKIAIKNGMTIMLEDGLNKVFNGITTLEEVLRVSSD